jgi:hypothetical protein
MLEYTLAIDSNTVLQQFHIEHDVDSIIVARLLFLASNFLTD